MRLGNERSREFKDESQTKNSSDLERRRIEKRLREIKGVRIAFDKW
jgi:hypothetical protein